MTITLLVQIAFPEHQSCYKVNKQEMRALNDLLGVCERHEKLIAFLPLRAHHDNEQFMDLLLNAFLTSGN